MDGEGIEVILLKMNARYEGGGGDGIMELHSV